MAIIQSNWAKGRLQTPVPARSGEVFCEVFEVNLVAPLAANDIIELGVLPAYAVPVDCYIDADDLDTGATLTLDVGLMSGDVGVADQARTVGQEFFTASNVAQAGGFVRGSKGLRVAATDKDRSIGVKAVGAGAGAGTGKLRLAVFFKQ